MSEYGSPGKPSGSCLLCPLPPEGGSRRRADDGYVTCSPCLDRLREQLREIVERWFALDPAPGGQGEHGSRGAPGFGSRSPASDHVIAMRDLRSQRVARVWRGSDGKVHRESERPVLSVHGELHVMCGYIAEAREMARPSGDVRALVAWLDVQLDWATRQPGVVELARVVRELAGQLRPVTGEPGRKRIGSCPVTIDEGEHTRECGAPLFAPLRGDEIVCPSGRRDHRWPRAEWLKLGQMIQLEVAS